MKLQKNLNYRWIMTRNDVKMLGFFSVLEVTCVLIKGSDLVVGSFDDPLFHFLLQPVSEDVRKTGTKQVGVFKCDGHNHVYI